MRILIGAGELCGGVYQFRALVPARAHKVVGLTEHELWHRRLGHPSKQILSFIPQIKSMCDSNRNYESCDICLRAKQTRDVFISSDNKAVDCFSLILYDLWGPYRVHASCGAYYFFTIVDNFSLAVWVYLLVEKREVEGTITNFCAMVNYTTI